MCQVCDNFSLQKMDLLVKLYDLPPLAPALDRVTESGARIHRPIAPERAAVVRWVTENFNERWASEVEMAFCVPELFS